MQLDGGRGLKISFGTEGPEYNFGDGTTDTDDQVFALQDGGDDDAPILRRDGPIFSSPTTKGEETSSPLWRRA